LKKFVNRDTWEKSNLPMYRITPGSFTVMPAENDGDPVPRGTAKWAGSAAIRTVLPVT
jgi:hypothetical protein